MKCTVLELDLAGYSDIAIALEEALDAYAVKQFEDQIQSFVDHGLKEVGLEREKVVLGTAGDNAVLIFDTAEQMHRFASSVQLACVEFNSAKSTPLSRRWFRMGAATGNVEVDESQRRILGTSVMRAVRLEAAAQKGGIHIDQATYDALPNDLQKFYAGPFVVQGKRDETFTAYAGQFIDEALVDESMAKAMPVSKAARDVRPTQSSRNVLLGILGVIGALSVVIALISWWFRPTEKLTGKADIHVLNSADASRHDRSVTYSGVLPLRKGDHVRLQVQLNRPAYIYLLWIAPSGNIIPVYPWSDGDWKKLNKQQPQIGYVYPSVDSAGVPMKPDVSGREIYLALARTTPLPSDVDLAAILRKCPMQLPVRDPKAMVRFGKGELIATVDDLREPNFFASADVPDEFAGLAECFRSSLGEHFEFIDGIAFASVAQ